MVEPVAACKGLCHIYPPNTIDKAVAVSTTLVPCSKTLPVPVVFILPLVENTKSPFDGSSLPLTLKEPVFDCK